uniref:Ion transport domain-containing protein n=1 Tax=Globisporangium ultimum (strain ATCC 200006 / CBS 805.95 / DAOM BR144) TaxID=431595 RepID=K3X139_GLOUD
MSRPVDDADVRTLNWQTLPNAEFDEIAARIIVNPQVGLLELKNPLIRRARDGSTLLHLFAGCESCDELLVHLINARVPVDMPDYSGWTPLLEAAQEGQICNCEVLLAHGATPDLATIPGGDMTPLRAAVKVGNEATTKWLLKQRGTWPRHQWDNEFFALLLDKTPFVAVEYLDAFAQLQSHSKLGNMAVQYTNLRFIYGEPHVPVQDTALGIAMRCPPGKQVLSHRVMRHVMKVKWVSFAKSMFRREFAVYCTLVGSYYIPTIWADPNWVQLASSFDYWVACCRAASWACSLYLLMRVEYYEYMGGGASAYFRSFWNWLNVTSYVATLVTIPFEFITSLTAVRNCLLALITVMMWVNMLQFLQVSTQSGLLLAMMSRMRKDVYRFFILYSVFLLGFSGAFYLLLRGLTGFESYGNAFLTVFLMLFGQLNYDTFNQTTGWTWHMSNALLMAYLLSVVIVLLNILIAMMATTYSDIWDAAETETMLCHAQVIIRMEKSLSPRTRTRKYNTLLGNTAATTEPHVSSDAKNLELNSATTVVDVPLGDEDDSSSSAQSHFAARKAMIASIVEKMKTMPKQAIENALTTSPTWSAVKPIIEAHAVNFHAPDLDALKESLYLKSTFDDDLAADDCANGIGTRRRELGLLEDGIRYESPVKTQSTAKSTMDVILELQTQVQQLTAVVKDLKAQGTQPLTTPQRRRRSLARYVTASAISPAELV